MTDQRCCYCHDHDPARQCAAIAVFEFIDQGHPSEPLDACADHLGHMLTWGLTTVWPLVVQPDLAGAEPVVLS